MPPSEPEHVFRAPQHQPLVSGILRETGDPSQGPNPFPTTSAGIDYQAPETLIRSEIVLTTLNRSKNKQTVQDRREKYFCKV